MDPLYWVGDMNGVGEEVGCQQQYRWAVGDIDGDVGYVSGVTEVVRDIAYC